MNRQDLVDLLSELLSFQAPPGEEREIDAFLQDRFRRASAEVWLSVKCGNDIFQENGDGSWVNPNGSSGPTAHAISNVVFCPPAGDDGSPQPGTSPGGDDEPYCSEVHPELCPGGVYPGDGSASPGEVPGGSVPGDGDAGSDEGDDDGSASPGEVPGGSVPGGSVPGDGDDGSDGELFCSEEHPELCPGGVYPGDGSSGSVDGGAGSLPTGGGSGLDGDDGTSSGDDGTSSGDVGTSGGSSGGSGTTTQCTEANLADCL